MRIDRWGERLELDLGIVVLGFDVDMTMQRDGIRAWFRYDGLAVIWVLEWKEENILLLRLGYDGLGFDFGTWQLKRGNKRLWLHFGCDKFLVRFEI